jgi:MFS family permease
MGGVLAGKLSLGRVAVVGLSLQAVGTIVLAVAHDPVPGAVGLAVLSMDNSRVWPSLNGMVPYQVPAERRSRAFAFRFGLMNVGIGTSSIIAAATVSVSRPDSFHVVYVLDGASTAIFAVILFFALRNTTGWTAHPQKAGDVR